MIPIRPGTAYSVSHVAQGLVTCVKAWNGSNLLEEAPKSSFLSGSCVFGNGRGQYVQLGEDDRVTFDDQGEAIKILRNDALSRCDLWRDLEPCNREGTPLRSRGTGPGRWHGGSSDDSD